MAQTGLTWRLAVDLLDKMNNPDNHQHYEEVDDDDLEVTKCAQNRKDSHKAQNVNISTACRFSSWAIEGYR